MIIVIQTNNRDYVNYSRTFNTVEQAQEYIQEHAMHNGMEWHILETTQVITAYPATTWPRKTFANTRGGGLKIGVPFMKEA